MYNPAQFVVSDPDVLVAFMRAHAFASVVTLDEAGAMRGSHLPLLVEHEGGRTRLLGHMARGNPGWQDGGRPVLAMFHGAHAFVSAAWYEEPDTVPTWNYQAVHATGTMNVIQDAARCRDIIERLSIEHDGESAQRWQSRLSDGLRGKLMSAIVFFAIEVTAIEGKWKLSQNHAPQRRRRVIDELRRRGGDDRRAVADAMEATLPAEGAPA